MAKETRRPAAWKEIRASHREPRSHLRSSYLRETNRQSAKDGAFEIKTFIIQLQKWRHRQPLRAPAPYNSPPPHTHPPPRVPTLYMKS